MELYVNAYSVPTICSPLSNQAVRLAVDNYPHLRGLDLADIPPSSDNVEIDILINEQLEQRIVESIPKEEQLSTDIHYLPHREVIRMDKETTKIRIVYVASARSNGPSLNDCLLAGPSLSHLIFDILIRFRLNNWNDC
jgi:hypothetical protein